MILSRRENQMSRKRRVAVTGIGAVSPAGNTMIETWNGIIKGESKAAPIRSFDAREFPCNFAYEVEGFRLSKELITSKEQETLNKISAFGIQAAAEAIEQAAIKTQDIDPARTQVVLGVGMMSGDFDLCRRLLVAQTAVEEPFELVTRQHPVTLTSIVARMLGAQGGAVTVHTACASSGQAIGEAYELIAYDDADVVLTGGSDSMIEPIYLTGFCLLGALSERNDSPATATRPFATDRDGFVLGEGACMVLLEEYGHALRRGAPILGEICGFGLTESAYRITDLHPEGRGPVEAMQLALADAGIEAGRVDYINAHGTSTYLNDRVESLAINQIWGNHQVYISSTKPTTGHMIAAAGAIELAVCLNAIHFQVLPPSINRFEQDATCRLELTPERATFKAMEYGLSNSIGFGGSNTSLVVRRAP